MDPTTAPWIGTARCAERCLIGAWQGMSSPCPVPRLI